MKLVKIGICCLFQLALVACGGSGDSNGSGSGKVSPPGSESPSNNPQGAERRISLSTGAIFERDRSNPKFGEAYRDPSGLIWSQIISSSMELPNAVDACKKIDARLPTIQELKNLRIYLGYDSQVGYSPFETDGSTEILPQLRSKYIWGAPDTEDYPPYYGVFWGATGFIDFTRFWDLGKAVRCVLDPNQP